MMRYLLILSAVAVGCGVASGGSLQMTRPKKAVPEVAAVTRSPRVVEPEPEPTPVPPPPAPLPPVPPVPVLPTLTLPEKVEGDVGEFIKVKAETNGQHVRWVAMDKGLAVFPAEMLKDSLSTVVLSNVPGQYRMLAYTAVADVPSDPATIVVVIHGAQPPPVPPVPPGPVPPVPPVPPNPTPIAVKLWIVSIDQVTARTPGTMAALLQFRASAIANGHEYRMLNDTDPEAAKFKDQIAAGGGLPVVVLMDAATNKWINKDPADLKLPQSAESAQALIRKFTGAK